MMSRGRVRVDWARALALISITAACADKFAPAAVPPIADAGIDSIALVGTVAKLDGSKSHAFGASAPLAYAWSNIARPKTSNATLDDPTSATPSFTVDAVGDYL